MASCHWCKEKLPEFFKEWNHCETCNKKRLEGFKEKQELCPICKKSYDSKASEPDDIIDASIFLSFQLEPLDRFDSKEELLRKLEINKKRIADISVKIRDIETKLKL